MSINGFKLIIAAFFLLLLLPELSYTQSIQFKILGKKSRPVKGATVHFLNNSCGADSLAVAESDYYKFNCFPDGVVPVHVEAKGYEQKTVLIKKGASNPLVTINLLKKGWQTIRLHEATYKFWKLQNVLYVKERNNESVYRLSILLDSLGLQESPYYGKDFYEHKNGQDFSTFDSPILKFIRNSEHTLLAAPVILLYRELKDGEKKFQTVNKLLPISNIIEFDGPPPSENVLNQFCLEKHWIYSDQVGSASPFAYKAVGQGAGLCILDIIETLKLSHPDLNPKIFDPGNWYSLEFDQVEDVKQ